MQRVATQIVSETTYNVSTGTLNPTLSMMMNDEIAYFTVL